MTVTGWQVCRPHRLEGRKRASLRTGEGPGLPIQRRVLLSGHCSRVLGCEES